MPMQIALVLLAILGACGSDQIHQRLLEPRPWPRRYDVRVLAVDPDRVILEPTADSTRPGVWGLRWQGGYGQIGRIIDSSPTAVAREFEILTGRLRNGEVADVDSWAYAGDPWSAHRIPYRVVDVPSPAGTLPSWFIGGNRRTWAIFVHGLGASPREALRLLPTLHRGGYPSLVIRYRNDTGAPPSADGLRHLGETEWRDLESAARFALERGAEDLLLIGYSMGGNIVTQFLRRSPLSERTAGAILDAPALDWGASVDQVGGSIGLPSLLTAWSKLSFTLRYGIDWRDLTELPHVDDLRIPILLFHGVDDQKVPVEVSDALAEARPDIVTYRRLPGTGHVEAWNVDPAAYEAEVRSFLQEIAS